MEQMTVKEVSRRSGVSIRTLQYYDKIGLLPPAGYTEAGYRLYDAQALERLQQILFFRELDFPLSEIREIVGRPDFDRKLALEQQIALLTLKKERLENLITLARGIQQTGEGNMDFTPFDKEKEQACAAEAKAKWGKTEAYAEYEKKHGSRPAETEEALGRGLMLIFAEFGEIKSLSPDSAAAQALVRKLQHYITANYYTCTKEILAGLGLMYTGDPRFAENIDQAGGPGTAQFAADAIAVCTQK